MNWAVYVIAGWTGLGALVAVATIGRQRRPMTPGTAAIIGVIDAAIIVTLVLAARRLS